MLTFHICLMAICRWHVECMPVRFSVFLATNLRKKVKVAGCSIANGAAFAFTFALIGPLNNPLCRICIHNWTYGGNTGMPLHAFPDGVFLAFAFIYTHTFIHAYMHTYIFTDMHVYTHIYIYTYIHLYLHAHLHTYTHIHNAPCPVFWQHLQMYL